MTKRGRPITTTGPLADLARAYPGGVQGLAEKLQVARVTLGKWRRKCVPRGPARELLAQLMHTHEITVAGRSW